MNHGKDATSETKALQAVEGHDADMLKGAERACGAVDSHSSGR